MRRATRPGSTVPVMGVASARLAVAVAAGELDSETFTHEVRSILDTPLAGEPVIRKAKKRSNPPRAGLNVRKAGSATRQQTTAAGKKNRQHELGRSASWKLTWDDVPGIHGVLVLDETEPIHELDLGDLARPMGREVSLDIGLGSWRGRQDRPGVSISAAAPPRARRGCELRVADNSPCRGRLPR